MALLLALLGIGLWGARILAVRGRNSGKWRTTPVNPLLFEGQRYLVSPRGLTDWVRNIRASGVAELRIGSRHESIQVTELSDREKASILRAYLKRWKWRTGKFFGGVSAEAPDEDLHRIALDHPVFRVDGGPERGLPRGR